MTLALVVQPMDATPGISSRAAVTVTNTGSSPARVSLSVAGIEPAWIRLPEPFGPLGPGSLLEAEIWVEIPAGHPAGQLVAVVTASTDGAEAVHGDLVVTIVDGSAVLAQLDPSEVRGGMTGRSRLLLRNRGRAPMRVDLDVTAPEPDLRVRFRRRTHVLQPGQEVRVEARMSARRPLTGPVRRRPFVVSVLTRGTPVHIEGAFTQRALFAPWLMKSLAVLAVVALWATVAVVGISDLSKHVNRSAEQKAIANSPPVTAPAGPSAANPAATAGGASAGSGTAGAGSSGGGAATTAGVAAAPSRVSGTVAAAQPGGVTVTLQPSSFNDGSSPVTTVSDAPTSGIVLAAATTRGASYKLYGADLTETPLPALSPSGEKVDSYSTTTSPDGFWAFASVPAGYYTVSFAKPGYSIASYVVDVTGTGKAVSLPAQLVPGSGSASGLVEGPSGPLGGVQLSITNGTVSLTTGTPTVGAVGTWALQGLSTPGTYLLTASDPGYSDQTTIFSLAAGASVSGIKLTMVPGAGSISGQVVSSSTGQPVGGLTVSASNGSVSRTTTTTTTGAVGTYSLPDLPVPGNYALTVSGAGYVTGTQQVDLGSDPSTANATANDTVAPSGADVNGVVNGPDGQGLPAAGLILSNQSSVFKTLSTSSGTVGSFDFGQVPPGSYVLQAEDFGYTTESAQVTIGSGQVQTVNLSLPAATDTSLSTATIQGSVDSLLTAKPIIGAAISIDGQPASVTTDANGNYSLPDVGPGVHTVTATCSVTAPCQSLDLSTNALATSAFESTTVQVDVALGAVTFASQILMPKLDSLAGIVVDGTGAKVPNPTVTLINSTTHISYPAAADPTASGVTAAQGGFEFDNLPYGTYTLQVTGPAPPTGAADCPGVEEYAPLTTSLSLAVDTDYLLTGSPGEPDASPVLTVLPQYRVNTSIVAQDGRPTPTAGVTVTVTSKTAGVNFSQSCTEDTAQPVVELPLADLGDSFDASFSYTPSGSTTVYSAPASAPFVAVDDNATIDSALLVPPSPGVTIAMSFPWRQPTGSVACTVTTTQVSPCPQLAPGDLPTVTLTGTVVAGGGTTTSSTFTASADPASGVWAFAPGALIGLAPGPVSFTVSGGAFQNFSVSANTSDANFGTQAFSLAPNLSTVAGSLATPNSGTAIEVMPPDPALLVSANAAASTDNIVWQETGQPTGEAFPGVYDLTFSHAGYDSTVVDGFTVALCDTTCTANLGQSSTPTVAADTLTFAAGSDPIGLDSDQTLTVTPAFAPVSGLAYPTVTVTNSAGSVVGSTQLSADAPTATFSGLSPTANNYTVTVTAPSFATSVTTVVLACSAEPSTVPWPDCGPATATPGAVSLTPTLTPLGYLTGLVQGAVNTSTSALAGATVTATLEPASASGCIAGSDPSTVSGQTASNGTFTLTNSSVAFPGLCVGATYDVSVTPPNGYSPPATSTYALPVAAGDTVVNSGNPIVLAAKQIAQTFVVSDGQSPLTGVTVTGSSVVGRPVSGLTSSVTLASGATVAEVTLNPDPTTYNYTFQLAQYATFSETITYTVGEAAQSTPITLAIDKNTIAGTVTTPGECAGVSPCSLQGATITLLSSSGAQVDQVTSGAKGAYSFPSSPSVVIPNGTYLVNVSLAGWQYSASYQPGVVTSPSLFTTHDVSLVPTPTSVSVEVTSNLAGLSSSGYTVSLVPASPPVGLALDCGTASLPATGEGASQTSGVALAVSSSIATFSQVVPDYYTLTVQGTGLPTQAYDSVVVCPGGEVAEYSPAPSAATAAAATPTVTAGSAAFEVLSGQITGTVAVSDNSTIAATALSVDIAPQSGSSGTTETVFVTCSNPSCTTGTFTSGLLVLGPTYDVTAQVPDVAGYAPSATQAVTPTNAAPTANATTLTVAPMPVEVEVTVDDVASQKPVSGLDVTLTPDSSMSGDSSLTTIYGHSLDEPYPLGPYTATTPTAPTANDPAGVAIFSQVVPDPGQPYSVTVFDGNAASHPPLSLESGGSPVASLPLTVSIGAASDNNVVDAYYTGSITGTVYDAVGNTDDVYLCSTSPCSATTKGAQSVAVKIAGSGSSGSGSYTFSGLNPTADGGTYYVGSDVAGSSSSAVTVTSGATATGPSFVAEGAVTATVEGQNGAAVTLYLCSTSPCTSSTTSHTVDLAGGGSASYTFASLAVVPGGTTYYVGSDITGSPTMTVTVEPGVTETATAFQEGSITGTVYDAAGSRDEVYLCSTTPCTAATTGVQSVSVTIATGSTSGSYTFSDLAPGAYYLGSSVAGSSSTKVTVTSGATATGPSFVAEGAVTATVEGQNGAAVTLYLCSTSPCASSTTSHTVDLAGGSASYTFASLAVVPGGTTYYVGSDITGSPTMTVTVEPGVTETATAFQEGSITGTVYDAAGSSDEVYLCSTTPCTATTTGVQSVSVTIATGSTSGSYTFSDLAPGAYYVGSDVAGSSSTKVTVTSGATATGPSFVAEGGITGTVDDAAGKTDHVYLCQSSPCTSSATSDTVDISGASGTGSASYAFSGLAPGTYYVGSDVAGAASTTPVTVASGATTTGPTFVAEGAITGTVTGTAGDKVTVYLCSSASCSKLSDATSSDAVTISSTGSSTYSFSGLAGNGTYYVGSSISTSTSTNVTTEPGVTVTGPTFTGG